MGDKRSSGTVGLVAVAVIVIVAVVGGYYVRDSWMRSAPPPEPAVDSVLQATIDELISAWDKVDAVSADVETRLNEALGRSGLTVGAGTYSLVKEEGFRRIKFDLRNGFRIMKEGERKGTLATEYVIWIADGDVLYHASAQPKWGKEEGTRRMAYKDVYDPGKMLQIGGRPLFELLRHDFTLEVLPDEELEGKPVTVLAGTPHGGDWRSLHYFDKDTGIRVQMIEEEPDGETATRITLKNIDLEPEFPPDHFQLNLPEGVEIEDRTQPAP